MANIYLISIPNPPNSDSPEVVTPLGRLPWHFRPKQNGDRHRYVLTYVCMYIGIRIPMQLVWDFHIHFHQLLQFGFSSVRIVSVFGNFGIGIYWQIPECWDAVAKSMHRSVSFEGGVSHLIYMLYLFCVPVTTRNYGRCHKLLPLPASLPAPLVAVTKRSCLCVCVCVSVCQCLCAEKIK